MMTYYHSDGRISYPISELKSGVINYSTLIELIIDEYGDGTYVSKNATIEMFGDYLVSSHAIFNVLNDIFNDKTVVDTNINDVETYRYASDLYFQSATYFLDNPYSKTSDVRIEGLEANQTITKRQLQRYIQEHGMEIDTIKENYDIFKWNSNTNSWKIDPIFPVLSETEFVPFNIENDNLIDLSPSINGTIYHGNANPIVAERNTVINIIGTISLPEGWNKPSTRYFIPEYNLWISLLNRNTGKKGLYGMTELHNIIDGVAYFSMSVPMSIGTRFSIVMPFEPGESRPLANEGSLFEGMTESNFAFAYYWGEDLFSEDSNPEINSSVYPLPSIP